MSNQNLHIKEETLVEILRPPCWDPIPPWLKFNDDLVNRFAKLEIQFKIKELQLQQEKLEQFSKMIV